VKILIVCSGNWGFIKPFVSEQVDALIERGIQVDYFLIHGKGITGYLKNLSRFWKVLRSTKYDLIHAHFGLSGFFAELQRKLPVVITFHGGDLIDKKNPYYKRKNKTNFHFLLSRLAAKHSTYTIFVNQNILVSSSKSHAVIPCGVNLSTFYYQDKKNLKQPVNLKNGKTNILFSSSINGSNAKNYSLACSVVSKIKDAELVALQNYSRKEVCDLMNACDLLLVTSFFETGPQVVKEAMACNCPIVSTDVGDVREVMGDTEGCYICSYDPQDVAEKIKLALAFGKRTNGREKILKYDNRLIAEKVIKVYEEVLGDRCPTARA